MKKLICICICSSFGCGRLQSGGNAENFDDVSGVGKHTPLSSDPANLPVPTPSPIPNQTAHANPDLDYFDDFDDTEICGHGNGLSYFYCSFLSFYVSVFSVIMIYKCSFNNKFFTILEMVSAFNFPVYIYLTNPSYFSKLKLSLTFLAGDTVVSLFRLIVKNPSIKIFHILVVIQQAFNFFQYLAYPHVSSPVLYILKRAIWEIRKIWK
ncbi:hypothetical protein [Candidatus Endomicrobiellum agilis]|uniref:hypothetical protein n=1 Tax=Candidatus Endomicrobiellum agilis TaxID=3238957 RepID=UPI00357AF1A6|nr:hypothetical protein [Endomicrobium sp.]